jgi:hypothetical protein
MFISILVECSVTRGRLYTVNADKIISVCPRIGAVGSCITTVDDAELLVTNDHDDVCNKIATEQERQWMNMTRATR